MFQVNVALLLAGAWKVGLPLTSGACSRLGLICRQSVRIAPRGERTFPYSLLVTLLTGACNRVSFLCRQPVWAAESASRPRCKRPWRQRCRRWPRCCGQQRCARAGTVAPAAAADTAPAGARPPTRRAHHADPCWCSLLCATLPALHGAGRRRAPKELYRLLFYVEIITCTCSAGTGRPALLEG